MLVDFIDLKKLEAHVKLCEKNLKSGRVKCCAVCPFEALITRKYPDLAKLFVEKRALLEQQGRAVRKEGN